MSQLTTQSLDEARTWQQPRLHQPVGGRRLTARRLDEVRAWLLRLHQPVGGWQLKRLFLVIPYPVWQPRICAADGLPWPDACPALRALRADDPELDHAIESGYLPTLLR